MDIYALVILMKAVMHTVEHISISQDIESFGCYAQARYNWVIWQIYFY